MDEGVKIAIEEGIKRRSISIKRKPIRVPKKQAVMNLVHVAQVINSKNVVCLNCK